MDPVPDKAGSEYAWQFYFQNLRALLDQALPQRILDVYHDGFGQPVGWSLGGVRRALKRSTVIGLLTSPAVRELGGYAFYSAPSEQLNGGWLLWEDAICLRKCLHGKQLSARVIEEVATLFPERELTWLGGRTQNPRVLKRYLQRAIEVLPLSRGYDSKQGKVVMEFLLHTIDEVREPAGMNPATGICHGVYPGRLGDFDIDLSDPEVVAIERRLASLGLNRLRGDAVIAVARLKQPLPKVGKQVR